MKTKQPEKFAQTGSQTEPRNTHVGIGVRDFWHFCKKSGTWQGLWRHCQHESCYMTKDSTGMPIPVAGAFANG